ncbi:MAG: hypothetical protein CVT88_06320 [Candidatus Altiarchaeales archaeon HGW-Altiarchaeales-1]|nr:MAG: hypothetical protein CVT88_06320 [Candidatus Altiarchaeales archaeon HGW-Altiarchaeales-1]
MDKLKTGFLVVLVGIVVSVMLSSASAADLKITYVDEVPADAEADGAWSGAWWSGEYGWPSMKLNPTESNFMSYLASYDSVFFSGHGNDDCIGGNHPNGFSGQVMCSNEINSCQATNEVTLMTCESYNDFGDELIDSGTSCVVGWPGILSANQQTGSDWAWYFYYCAQYSTDSGTCENWASANSGLSGSASKGSCSNTHGTSTGKTNLKESETNLNENKDAKKNKPHISNIPVKFKRLYDEQGNVTITAEANDGKVISYLNVAKYKNKGTKNITKERALDIAKEKIKVPKDYVLTETEDEDNSYNFMFNRVIDNISLKSDWIWVSVNKGAGEISMWSKVYHEELPDLKPTISKEGAIKIANEEFNGGAEISELTVVGCDEDALCLAWLVVDSDSKLYNYIYLDAHTGKRI